MTYVRTAAGHEVDFLARQPDGKMHLVQVCADASAPETAGRELRALEAAGEQYPKADRLLLTLTRDTMPAGAPSGVKVQPAYEWMLAEPGEN